MSEYENKPLTGNDFKNGVISFIFDDTDKFPFYEKENEYEGKKTMKYGYKITNVTHTDGETGETPMKNDCVFFTQTAKDIIDAASCKKNQKVSMELKSGQTKDGHPYTIWILDGKSRKQWAEEPQQETTPTAEPPKEPVVEENVESKSSAQTKVDLTKAMQLCRELSAELEFINNMTSEKDEDIPF